MKPGDPPPPQDFSTDKFDKYDTSEYDIDGQILSILTRGLYTNPLDCIREYVQNGADAGATQVTIRITGNSVVIHDNGAGMTREELIRARRLGYSAKDPLEDVGFRGIGIYSGYDLCSRMVLTTRRIGDAAYRMRLEFDEMKKNIALDPPDRLPLLRLLYEYTAFKRIDWPEDADSFTIVELQEISAVHIRALSDREGLKRYILHNLPVDFDSSFQHRNVILQNLRAHVPGFKAVRVVLQSDNQPDEVVCKPAIDNLDPPQCGLIEKSTGGPLAYYWACLSGDGAIGKDDRGAGELGPKSYQGFVYKCKGFSVGGRHALRRTFKTASGTLYSWYTGEIYVIDPEIVPNAARDGFEPGGPKAQLEIHVQKVMKALENHASTVQKRKSAERSIAEALQGLSCLEDDITGNRLDEYTAYTRLEGVREELKKQRVKASSELKRRVDVELKHVEGLQKKIQARAEKLTQPSKPASQPSRAPEPRREAGLAVGPGERGIPASITEIFLGAGYCASPDARVVVEMLDEVLIALYGRSSATYGEIAAAVRERVENGSQV